MEEGRKESNAHKAGVRNVAVRIVGTQRQLTETEEQEEKTELAACGVCSYRNGKYYVVYEEEDGEGHVTRNMVKIRPDSFEVIKSGAGSARMVFRPGERDESWYETPYGRLPVALCVREVQVNETTGAETFLDVRAGYVLELNGEPSAECTVRVTVAAW